MDDSKLPEKQHSREKSLKFGRKVADLVAGHATDDDLDATMADPNKLMQIAAALDQVMFPREIPTATVDTPQGKVQSAPLADAVFDPQRVAAQVMESADRHLADHIVAMRTSGNPLCRPDEPGSPGELRYNAGD